MRRSRLRWSALLGVVLSITLAGCRTPGLAPVPPAPVPPGLDERVAEYLDALAARHDSVSALRARARSEARGASGDAFSRQLLLLERPARMRIEVLGLLGQRALVLATDGRHYEVFRAGVPGIEQGEVHPGVLWDVAGVPLAPDTAVSILLAAPEQPAGGAPPRVRWDGGSGEAVVAYPDHTFHFDGPGRLRGYRWHPDGHDWVVARYDDWRPAQAGENDAAFPHTIVLDFPSNGGRVRVALSDVELNPALDAALFRLRAPEPLSSDAEGDGG